jgi:hypothetical protein
MINGASVARASDALDGLRATNFVPVHFRKTTARHGHGPPAQPFHPSRIGLPMVDADSRGYGRGVCVPLCWSYLSRPPMPTIEVAASHDDVGSAISRPRSCWNGHSAADEDGNQTQETLAGYAAATFPRAGKRCVASAPPTVSSQS